MISYLSGRIVDITTDSIIIDVNGVGYLVYVGKPQDFSYGETLVHTYYLVKEDGVYLYGFKTKQEKDLFLRLIEVNGIGPKTANGIVGAASVNNLITAIETGNIAFLKKLPSIGPKAAQQIILDLKGKLVYDNKSTINNKTNKYEDIYDALRGLGFKVGEIDIAINKVNNIETLDTKQVLKECLKMLKK